MSRLLFTLNISASDYLAHYKGAGKTVITNTENGHRLQFPANELRKFVSHTGVHGRFEIVFSRDNRLLDLKRIS